MLTRSSQILCVLSKELGGKPVDIGEEQKGKTLSFSLEEAGF